ncbi:CopD family protein [Streptoalloteichus hindustanus]|uniref:Putative copper resistance protein D n=1 Tax=Streptoalloteichus hindustanus TaxID=2017 RepID=A0A1M4V8B5_STRHI|nr:CopD family protein [Streptoalloteichus hindustanus]SHE65199.1 putative copper resistance protein D [Streptoalloteichus hindustanus]
MSRTAAPARAPRRLGGAALAALAGAALGAWWTADAVPPVPGLPEPGAAVRLVLPMTRLVMDLAAVAAVGLGTLPWLLRGARPREVDPVRVVAHRAGVVLGAGWAATALVLLWLQTAELAGSGLSVDTATVVEYATTVSAGRALLVTTACALLVALTHFAALAGRSAPAGLGATTALLGLLPTPLTGHAADMAHHTLSVVAIGVHAAAAAVWVGGLGALLSLVVPRRGALATALPAFSRLATAAVVAVVLSGLVTAVVRLAGELPEALVLTRYGVLVLAKTACLLALAALGGHVRRRLLPLVVAHRATPLAAWVTAELVVMGLALGLAAVLARTPTGIAVG